MRVKNVKNFKKLRLSNTLKNLRKSPKSRITFFNTNYGSNIEPCNNTGFQYNPQKVMYTISEVLDVSPSGNFEIIGQLHWMEEPRKVYCGSTKVERLVRAGMLADTKNSIKVSALGTLTETINANKTYKFRNVSCNFFNGVRISTNPSTIMDSTEMK